MLVLFLAACTGGAPDTSGDGAFAVDAWADNWFAWYVDGALVMEDSVPITTERSFNAESFSFDATRPFTIGVELKDYMEDDSGLEYIGEANQQMGDGGFIAQVFEGSALAAVTSDAWRCLVTQHAPVDTACEHDAAPSTTCTSETTDTPDGWADPDFDDSTWEAATEWTSDDVGPKDGYDEITWDPSAAFIWGTSLKQDNILLCRVTVD